MVGRRVRRARRMISKVSRTMRARSEKSGKENCKLRFGFRNDPKTYNSSFWGLGFLNL